MAKRPANINAWKDTAAAKAKEDGYADPANMVAASEDRMHAANWHMYPWTNSTWVSVSGIIYEGNGGNEREEWFWFNGGPWLLLDEERARNYKETYKEAADDARAELQGLKTKLREALDTLGGLDD